MTHPTTRPLVRPYTNTSALLLKTRLGLGPEDSDAVLAARRLAATTKLELAAVKRKLAATEQELVDTKRELEIRNGELALFDEPPDRRRCCSPTAR